MPGYDRTDRIAEEMRKLLSNLIRDELKDPRIAPMTVVTRCEVTRDLRYCKAYISVYGDEKAQTDTIKALKNAGGKLRGEIGRSLGAHYSPQLSFIIDRTIEHGIHIGELLKQIAVPPEEDEDA